MREKWGKKKVRQIETGKEDGEEAKRNGNEGRKRSGKDGKPKWIKE